MENQEQIHIGKAIQKELLRQGRRPSWLAEQLNFERTNIYHIFRRKSIDCELLLRISRLLDTDFFSLYSSTLQSSTARQRQ